MLQHVCSLASSFPSMEAGGNQGKIPEAAGVSCTCRDVIQSGVFVARMKRRQVDVNRVELLASMRGDSPDQAYRNTPQPPGMPVIRGNPLKTCATS